MLKRSGAAATVPPIENFDPGDASSPPMCRRTSATRRASLRLIRGHTTPSASSRSVRETYPEIAVDGATLDGARQAYALSIRRSAALGNGLFSDPAWNMLLDLLITNASGRRLSVKAVCLGSQSSSATALRYLSALGAGGYIERFADCDDGRRSYVQLSTLGRDRMIELLSTCQSEKGQP